VADRTVTTHLVAKVARYVAPMREADRATAAVTDELHDAARAGKDFGRDSAAAAGMATGAFATAGVAASGLSHRIDETRDHLRHLIRDFERTGNVTLFKNIRQDRSMLSSLQRMRRELANVGDEGGRSMMSGFASHLSQLAPLLKGAAITGGVAAGVALAPLIGATIGAAVLGSVGAGGIIGGIALAARDARVKTAAQAFADRVGDAFGTAASPFVGPIVDSLEILGAGAERLARQASGVFRSLAPELRGLTSGLVGLAEHMMPGIRAAAEAARPLLRVLARELPQIGDSISQMLQKISRESPGAVLALKVLLDVAESAIVGIGNTIAFLAAAFEKIVRVAAEVSGVTEDIFGFVPVLGDKIREGNDRMEALLVTLDGLQNESYESAKAGGALQTSLEDQAAATQQLIDKMAELFSATMTAEQANARYEESWDELAGATRGANKSLDDSTAKGRINRDMIRQHISAIEDNRSAYIRQGGSVVDANKKYDAQLVKLRNLLVSRGYEASAVDRIIGKYRAIPKNVTTTLTVKQQQALAAVNALKVKIASLKNKSISISAQVYWTNLGMHVPGGTQVRRWGGITEHAQSGLLREAAMYSARSPARYAFAEPATGGEGFVPRRGNPAISRPIIEREAQWYGGRVAWGGGRMGGDTYIFNIPNYVGDRRDLENWLVKTTDKLRVKGRL
jgi:hypothetical protein